MKIAIMQPYFFPYIGYWQLINVVDMFVIYDDVNYINRGWINRNRILFEGTTRYFSIPLIGASQNKKINEIKINNDDYNIKRSMSVLHQAYRKAPYYDSSREIVRDVLMFEESSLSRFLANSIFCVSRYLRINTQFVFSSEVEKDNSLKGQEKIIEICKRLGADEYYNPIGGTKLYERDTFERNGIDLHFVKSMDIKYHQFMEDFIGNLSIIDVMMFNDIRTIKKYMTSYTMA